MKDELVFSIEFHDFLDPTLLDEIFTYLKGRARALGVELTRSGENNAGTFHIFSSAFFLADDYQAFDWSYLFRFARKRSRDKRAWSFYVYSDEGEFYPDEDGQAQTLASSSELWADGGLNCGLIFAPSLAENEETSHFAWLPVLKNPDRAKPALFLDRDGILNRDRGHVHQIDDLEWKEEIFEVLQMAHSHNFQLIVLTNQSGMARGYYDEQQMNELHRHMHEYLESRVGVTVDGWYHCPYHPKGEVQGLDRRSTLRKPMAGMPLKAAFEQSVDLTNSLMVGDKLTDRFRALDLETYLVAGDYFEVSQAESYYQSLNWGNQAPYYCFEDFLELVDALKVRIQGEKK